ncbi:MAG TPA: hypothetical protein VIL28_06295 [Steroidobacteraceae bacterium]
MPRNRQESNRPERRRGARYQTGPERDRYRTGDERRFQPSKDDEKQAFDGDESYPQGGYAEEVGHRHTRDSDVKGTRRRKIKKVER